jgi:hypothetical protein
MITNLFLIRVFWSTACAGAPFTPWHFGLMQTSFPVGCWINPTNPLQQAQFIGLRVFKKSNTYDQIQNTTQEKWVTQLPSFLIPKTYIIHLSRSRRSRWRAVSVPIPKFFTVIVYIIIICTLLPFSILISTQIINNKFNRPLPPPSKTQSYLTATTTADQWRNSPTLLDAYQSPSRLADQVAKIIKLRDGDGIEESLEETLLLLPIGGSNKPFFNISLQNKITFPSSSSGITGQIVSN